MAIVVLNPHVEKRLLEEREAAGQSQYDEVWDGVYVMSPLPNNEHQGIVTGLSGIFLIVIEWLGLGRVLAGCNISDRETDWLQNYREPDVAVFLNGTTARNLGTHWVGGPDFAVEVLSPDDWTRRKLPFYAAVGTRELLLVDRDPWALELYRLWDGELILVGTSTPDRPEALASAVLPLSVRLVAAEDRPRIEVTHADGQQNWRV